MEINRKEIETILKKYNNKKSALLSILQDIQEKYNWLPQEALRLVSEKICVPLIDVYSVATFYRAFKLVEPGKHNITVCMGTACHVWGSPNVIASPFLPLCHCVYEKKSMTLCNRSVLP
jgi:NADH-quinone oxidoreductase subunit E